MYSAAYHRPVVLYPSASHDEDKCIFSVQRPIILNGIEEFSTLGDLVDRFVIVDLPRIPSDKRRTEDEYWAAFREAHPRILGALLDALRKHSET